MDLGVQRIPVSRGADDVAHDFLHQSRHRPRQGVQGDEEVEDDAKRVHAQGDADRVLLRRVAVVE